MVKFTKDNGTIEPFTIVLSSRDYTHLGQISNIDNVNFKANLNSADEISFDVYKTLDNHDEFLWDEIFDLRLIWVKELDEYFEINVNITDKTYLTKTITATSLCESELSQVYLHDIEINTEEDIDREDYDPSYPTIFFRSGNYKNSSLMHRILEKVPAYTFDYTNSDETLFGLQANFSISDSTIYDFLTGECAEQFDCLFLFDSKTRKIVAKDLNTVCRSCGHRGKYNDVCPKCGSTNLKYYGQDTSIFISTENLTDEVKFETDIKSVKNCFRLVAGDDDMTAAVININPNGSQYIYNFSNDSFRDMPSSLVDKIKNYSKKYAEARDTKVYTTPTLPSVSGYTFNSLVTKYNAIKPTSGTSTIFKKITGKDLISIPSSFTGYSPLIEYIYEAYEFDSFLTSGLMPDVSFDITNASTERNKLNALNGQTVSLSSFTSSTSKATVESAILNYAKVLVKTGFVKLRVNNSSYSNSTWTGTIDVINYSDDEDIATTNTLTIKVNGAYSTFMEQKIAKQITASTENLEDSYYNILKSSVSLSTFKEGLKKYSLNRIASFRDACDAVLSVLIQAGVTDGNNSDTNLKNLYTSQYTPYFNKYNACVQEYNTRSLEIEAVEKTLDTLLQFKNKIKNDLDFKTALGSDYNLFTTYIREDTYTNSNYISDNLSNSELFTRAKEFFETAEKELVKSSTYQHSISTNIKNLLTIKEFDPIKNSFELGNWIRVKSGDDIYRLRLISYSVDDGDYSNLNTDFSDVTKTSEGFNDIESILKQASSVAGSYNSVSKQAEQSAVTGNYIQGWIDEGLNSALTTINNNDNEEIQISSAGIIGRTLDDINGGYSKEQIRVTHNMIAFTDNAWSTVSTALGKIKYKNTTTGKDINTFGLITKHVLSGYIAGTEIESCNMTTGLIQNLEHKTNVDKGNYINMNIDSSSTSDFIHTTNFKVNGKGTLASTSGRIQNSDNTYYLDMGATGSNYTLCLPNFTVKADGSVVASSGTFTGTINARSGVIGGGKDSSGKDKKTWNIGADATRAWIYSGVEKIDDENHSGLYLGTDGFRNYYINKTTKRYSVLKDGQFKTYQDDKHYIDTSGNSDYYIIFGDNFSVTKKGVVSIGGYATTDDLPSDYLTSYDLSSEGSTSIYGGRITTGTISSNGADGSDGKYASKGTKINLDSGWISSKNFCLSSNGNAYFRGSIQSSSIGQKDTNDDTTIDIKSKDNVRLCFGSNAAWTNGCYIITSKSDRECHDGFGTRRLDSKYGDGTFLHWDAVRLWDWDNDKIAWEASFNDPSDLRLKSNISNIPIDTIRNVCKKIQMKYFIFRNQDGSINSNPDARIRYGFIAQDIKKIFEEENIDDRDTVYDRGDGFLKLEYDRLGRFALPAIGDLYRIVESQKEEIDKLKLEIYN